MGAQFRLAKIILGFSLIISAIGVVALSFFDNLDSDKAWLGLLVYPPAIFYIYLLSKFFINAFASSERKGFEDFMILSIIAMVLPFGILFIYYSERKFDVYVGLCIYLVVLWLINVNFCILERRNNKG